MGVLLPSGETRNYISVQKERSRLWDRSYVCDMNVKFKKKQSTFLNLDPWARLVGSRNTAAIYIDGIATTALYDTGAELQLISKEFCEQNKLKIQPIQQLIECKGVVRTGLLEYDGYVVHDPSSRNCAMFVRYICMQYQ